MAYLSFHAGKEGKIKMKNINKASGHTFRKSEQRYKNHGNKEIDKAKTKNNIDTTIGDKSIFDLVNERLENDYKGKRSLRKDAVVIREIIVQASTDVYEGLNDDEKREKSIKFLNDSLDWFKSEFGEKNVLGASVHMDETNPHIHFYVMPMTQDGRLSQKDFFKGPNDLKRQHREYREHMNSKNWDFELENKYDVVDEVPLDIYKKVAPKLEKERAKHQEIMENLAKDRLSDSKIEDIAVQLLLNDKGEKLKEKLEIEREELRAQREKFLLDKAKLDKRKSEVMLESSKLFDEKMDLKKDREALDKERQQFEEEYEEENGFLLAFQRELKSKNEKSNKLLNLSKGVVSAIFKGDPKRQKAYRQLNDPNFDPDFNFENVDIEGLKNSISDSLSKVHLRNKSLGSKRNISRTIEQHVQEDEGPDLQ